MKRILPFLLLALCCACEKEEAVSLETLSGFLRSQKWTGASVRTNAQGEEVQRDSLTLYFVDDSLGLSRLHVWYLDNYSREVHFDSNLEPFRYKVIGDRTLEILTYSGLKVRMELDQPQRTLQGNWDGFTEWTAAAIQSEDRDKVIKGRSQCGISGPELFWLKSGNILYLKGKGPMFDYPSREKVPWHSLGITAILMDDGITSLGNWAFAGLVLKEHNVVDLHIPASVTRIGDYAFYRCSPLPVSFRNVGNLVSIGEHAFEQSALVAFSAIGNLQTIGDYAFHDIPNLKLYFEGKSVKQIGAYAFSGFSSLSPISIFASTVEIGTHAFEGSFRTLVLNGIPSRMEKDAFVPYDGNANIQVPISRPPTVNGLPIDPREWTLQVPSGSKAAYQAASPWNQFKNIIEYTAL